MVKLPEPTIDAIYQWYKNNEDPQRDYLGGSIIGEPCERYLWYTFRNCYQPKFEGRILRLFETGKREEERIIANLRAIGCEVFDRENGKQIEYVACNGHFKIHLDGVVTNLQEAPKTPHVLETKTANKNSFDDLEKNGVEKSKPVHFAQMQVYMGLAELTRAVYICQCKDDDRLYLERIEFQKEVFDELMKKAKRIIDAQTPQPKISEDPSSFVCRFCKTKDICTGESRPLIHCKTCVHGAPDKNGKWKCEQNKTPDKDFLCHLIIPDLIPWAEPIDGTPEYIHYKLKNGIEFVNGVDLSFSEGPKVEKLHYSSLELAAIPIEAIGNEQIELARTILNGRITQ